MRKIWTDDRLDHLNCKVDEGFRQVDQRFDRVEGSIRDLRVEMDQRFSRLDAKFDRLQQNLVVAAVGLIGTMILAFGGVIATQL